MTSQCRYRKQRERNRFESYSTRVQNGISGAEFVQSPAVGLEEVSIANLTGIPQVLRFYCHFIEHVVLVDKRRNGRSVRTSRRHIVLEK